MKLASSDSLATTMVLRGSAGALIGAASSPTGREGIYGVVGFAAGALLGDLGIVTLAMAALYRKATVEPSSRERDGRRQ